jgi:hypothetical protein
MSTVTLSPLDIPNAGSSHYAVSSPTYEIIGNDPHPLTSFSSPTGSEVLDSAYTHIPPATDPKVSPSFPVAISPVSALHLPATLPSTSSASQEPPFSSPKLRKADLPKHKQYYLDDGNVTFAVGAFTPRTFFVIKV